jgi:tetratricopeptide (TPR) repeat protein
LRETSDLPGAIAIAQRVLALIALAKERGEDKPLAGSTIEMKTALAQLEFDAHFLLGSSFEYQGNYRDATVQLEKALGLARTAGLHREEARALSSLAYNNDSPVSGKDYLEAALPIYRKAGDRSGESACLEKLGYALLWIGDYDGAVDCYRQSLQLSRQIGFRGGEMAALFRLGHFYNQVGDYLQGKGYLEQALSMARSDHDYRRAAYHLFNISVSERGLGQTEAAKKHTQEALAICQKVGDHNGEINAWNILGSACAALQQWDEAATAFRRALDLVQRPVDPGGTIFCQAKLAGALLGQGKLAQALEHVEAILAYQESGGNLQGSDEGPIPVYMECYHVLQATSDPRAQKIFHMAYALLQEQVSRIKDETIRQSFLENKPENRDLMEACECW